MLAGGRITFDGADAAVAFVDLEVGGVEHLEGHFFAVAAAFVQHVRSHISALAHFLV